ncbi:MAG: hypothetical protein WA977_05210 [Halobacteriota archaeon]
MAWEGFLFVKGVKSGGDSISKFSKKIIEKGIESACDCLSGVFGCILQDKRKNEICAFTDNNGLFNLFYCNNPISISTPHSAL